MFAEWLCGTCYPRIVKGTYGKVIIHGLNFHKLGFKEARRNLTLESEAREWQEKKTGIRVGSSPETNPRVESQTESNPKTVSPETRPATGEKAETGPAKKLAGQ